MNIVFWRFILKAASFSYFKASTIEEAVALKDKDENSIFLAGGQSLMPTLNMRYLLHHI